MQLIQVGLQLFGDRLLSIAVTSYHSADSWLFISQQNYQKLQSLKKHCGKQRSLREDAEEEN